MSVYEKKSVNWRGKLLHSKSTKISLSSTAEETILKYLVFPTQLKITAQKKKLFLYLPVLLSTQSPITLKLVIELEKAEIVLEKTIARFTNRKFVKQALYIRNKLKSIDKSTLGLTKVVFINKNLTPENNRIAYNCRKPKRQNLISKTYTVNGVVQLISNNIKRGKPVKVLPM